MPCLNAPLSSVPLVLLGALVLPVGCFPAPGLTGAGDSAGLAAHRQEVMSQGRLLIVVKWPERASAVIPTSAQTLDLAVSQSGNPVASTSLSRPASSRSFTLAAGSYLLEIKARPGIVGETDFSGEVIARLTQSFTVHSSAITTATFNIESGFEPLVGSISPANFNAGDTVTVNGSNLQVGWSPNVPVVTFPRAGGGTTAATVTSQTGTSLAFTVPADAATSGAFIIAVDGVATSYPYVLGATDQVLSAGSFEVSAGAAAGTSFQAPVGQGVSCVFTAGGSWKWSPLAPFASARGDSAALAGGSAPLAGSRLMLLVIRRGSGSHQSAGTSTTFAPASGESLSFLANDETGSYGDNSGSQTVYYTCRWPQSGSFDVSAASDTGTTFQVPARSDMHCQFGVSGGQTWNYGAAVGADGDPAVTAGSTFLLPGARAGALIVRRGDSTYEPAGSSRSLAAASGEALQFMINEIAGQYGGNGGSLTVSYSCGDATSGDASATID